uniref:Uncharacterized protein n=1 Tax=Parascaris univalens TaxID=6257 RepID=A0A915AS89_PARUN
VSFIMNEVSRRMQISNSHLLLSCFITLLWLLTIIAAITRAEILFKEERTLLNTIRKHRQKTLTLDVSSFEGVQEAPERQI